MLALVVAAACRSTPPPTPQEVTIWRPLGRWSGHGATQTDPFISETGLLRLTWEARGPSPGATDSFKVALHSDVSGRFLTLAVDHHGPGRDVAYVNEDPRSFFLVVESSGLEWSIEVAEGITGTRP